MLQQLPCFLCNSFDSILCCLSHILWENWNSAQNGIFLWWRLWFDRCEKSGQPNFLIYSCTCSSQRVWLLVITVYSLLHVVFIVYDIELFCRALVEVKPVLYIPENGDYGIGNNLLGSDSKEMVWDFQTYTISGKICAALVSITKDVAAKICPNTEPELISGDHIRVIAKFCVFLVNKVLLDNYLFWGDLMVRFSLKWNCLWTCFWYLVLQFGACN